MPLNARQARFVAEYLVDLNATQAAIRAGYSAGTARQMGAENLSKPDIQAAIGEAQASRSHRTGVTADRVVLELARVAFGDPRRVMSWGPGAGATHEIRRLKAALRRGARVYRQTRTKGMANN